MHFVWEKYKAEAKEIHVESICGHCKLQILVNRCHSMSFLLKSYRFLWKLNQTTHKRANSFKRLPLLLSRWVWISMLHTRQLREGGSPFTRKKVSEPMRHTDLNSISICACTPIHTHHTNTHLVNFGIESTLGRLFGCVHALHFRSTFCRWYKTFKN